MKPLNIISAIIIAGWIVGCASTGGKDKFPVSNKQIENDPAAAIVEKIAGNSGKLANKRIAVTDFSDIEGNTTEEGSLLAEQIITGLAEKSEIKVIERKKISKLLEEKGLGMSGVIEQDEKSIGQILDVDAIVSGTIAYLEGYEEINARLIDVDTGEIYCAIKVKRDMAVRQRELEGLSEEKRGKIEQEYGVYNKQKIDNPELFKLGTRYREELVRLREERPDDYVKVVSTLKKLKQIKQNRPKLFRILFLPKDSSIIQNIRERNPDQFVEFQQMRKEIRFIEETLPSYIKAVLHENMSEKNTPE